METKEVLRGYQIRKEDLKSVQGGNILPGSKKPPTICPACGYTQFWGDVVEGTVTKWICKNCGYLSEEREK